ncbi:MAG: PQQ-binding-like beta-propeller repeat protein [Bacteroidales bacterium]|nr:PQQ-binding-like beta-propeller repeat protein [Bacteroidales bacterium]
MKLIKLISSLFILSFLIVSCNSTPKVYEWRGEGRLGHYPDKNLLKSWPENGPQLLWEFNELGYGYGAPIFTEDRMFILGEIDSIEYLFSFDLEGKLLWRVENGEEWTKTFRGSRSTPTVVDDLLYVCSGMGNISCFNSLTGESVWKKSFIQDFQGVYTMHGHSESPIIDEEKVFLMPGGQENNVVALNRYTGDVIWKNKGFEERPAYNAPQLIKLANRHILVQFSAYHLMGLDTKTGELLWAHEQDNVEPEKRRQGMGDTHSNTAIYENGYIYYVTGDGNGAVKLKLSEDGSKIEEIWRNPDFDGFMSGVVSLGDYEYGGGTRKPILMRIHKKTGEIDESLKIGTGTIIEAEGLLYYYNQKGNVMLINPKPEGMEVISSFTISKGQKEHFAHPVIHHGILYIRHGEHISAYDIRST